MSEYALRPVQSTVQLVRLAVLRPNGRRHHYFVTVEAPSTDLLFDAAIREFRTRHGRTETIVQIDILIN